MSTAAPLQTLAAKPQPLSSSTHAGLLLQRKCACGSPTSSLTGECAECASKKRLQTKLTIGASNDPLEQEADRVADQVLAAPANPAVSGAPPHIQRFTRQATGQADTAPASVDHALAGPGRPLEPALRQDMEQRFGHDFSKVRVHSDTAAEQSARELNAHAYTVGRNIVFGAGQFAPGSHQGRHLIAHELTHVVQQSGADGNSIRRNNENCGGSAISQPVAEGRAVARSVQRQPAPPAEIEMPAEFAADERKRTGRRYARSLGRKDAARIRKSGKLSSEDREEVNAKLRFFEGQARAAYIQEIKPALVEATREETKTPAEDKQSAAEADRIKAAEKEIAQALTIARSSHHKAMAIVTGASQVDLDLVDIVQAQGEAVEETLELLADSSLIAGLSEDQRKVILGAGAIELRMYIRNAEHLGVLNKKCGARSSG